MSDSFVKEIGRSYIVSAFLPAAFFVTIGYFLFHGFLPLGLVKQIIATSAISNLNWVVVFFLILWSAFYLYSANDITVRLFEGYFITKFRTPPETKLDFETWEAENLPAYSKWKKKLEQLSGEGSHSDEDFPTDLEAVLNALAEIVIVSIKKPLDPGAQMPTRLGNVFRSSEMYAFERYFIVEIAIWPRLLPVLPPEITKHLEEKNNQFMFLLNSAFLCYIIAGISLLFGTLVSWINLPDDFFYLGYEFVPSWSYILISLFLFVLGYLLYCAAVNAAEDFGMYIRASFDLYRSNLLHQMNWELPETLDQEKNLWLEISKLIIGGSRFPTDFSEYARYFPTQNIKAPVQEGQS